MNLQALKVIEMFWHKIHKTLIYLKNSVYIGQVFKIFRLSIIKIKIKKTCGTLTSSSTHFYDF